MAGSLLSQSEDGSEDSESDHLDIAREPRLKPDTGESLYPQPRPGPAYDHSSTETTGSAGISPELLADITEKIKKEGGYQYPYLMHCSYSLSRRALAARRVD